ncbi:hypothetical protein [Nocardia bovistercoris]|uniref:Integral membrane protein n=1 Tax=Nocardia bovistercoris TaxID=2785916 RepID=A0A931N535_9NOCA|nr:hypothetical protein [Nocardia bovistercoris]MBH0779449.1 hypothetical protein [Nocardia bovistercoris]
MNSDPAPSDPAPSGPALSEDERRELLRLRREVAELRAAAPRRTRSRGRLARGAAVVALLVLTAVLAFAAVPARYLHGELLDTERYLATVGPLADDPVIRADLTDAVTDRITERLDLERTTADALTALTRELPRLPDAVTGLAPVLAKEGESFIRDTVADYLASDRFRARWIEANQRAHRILVGALTGETRDGVRVENGTVAIDLGPIIDAVRARLTERGFTFAAAIPDVDTNLVLIDSPRLAKAQRATSALDTAATVLPAAAVLAALGAVALTVRGKRRRTVALVGVALAVSMLALAIAIAVGRAVYLREIPADALSPEAAGVLFDTLALPLRTAVRAVFVLAVVLAAVGYLTGPSRPATALRRGLATGLDAVRTPDRAPYRLESAVAAHRTSLRIAVVVAAAATLVFWRYPSGVVVAVTVLIALAALLLVELIARPARARTGSE